MSQKNSYTTSDYVRWDKMMSLTNALYNDGDYKFAMLLMMGSCLGLRISDLRQLTWQQLLSEKSILDLHEKKTKKFRRLKINEVLHEFAADCSDKLGNPTPDSYIMSARLTDKPMSVQYINRRLKKIKQQYQLNCCENFSTHSLRKTFGRHVVEKAENAELGLIRLNKIFNHANIATTRTYLGITQDEQMEMYENLF